MVDTKKIIDKIQAGLKSCAEQNSIDAKNVQMVISLSGGVQLWNADKNVGVIDKIAKEMGLKWGGGGQFGSYHDPVHFFIEPDGKSTTQLLAIHNSGKVDSNGYVIV